MDAKASTTARANVGRVKAGANSRSREAAEQVGIVGFLARWTRVAIPESAARGPTLFSPPPYDRPPEPRKRAEVELWRSNDHAGRERAVERSAGAELGLHREVSRRGDGADVLPREMPGSGDGAVLPT